MNVCYVLQSSDKSHCWVNSDAISSLYTAPSHISSVADVLAETSFIRVTFAGNVIHSMVCAYF